MDNQVRDNTNLYIDKIQDVYESYLVYVKTSVGQLCIHISIPTLKSL